MKSRMDYIMIRTGGLTWTGGRWLEAVTGYAWSWDMMIKKTDFATVFYYCLMGGERKVVDVLNLFLMLEFDYELLSWAMHDSLL